MERIVLIFIGGGFGSIMRYLMQGWVHKLSNGHIFPFGTLAVNLVGCAVIGFLASLFTGPVMIRAEYRLAILVGVLGGFTTFSSYAWETLSLTDDRQWWLAMGNILASNVLGLTFAWFGARLATRMYGS